MLLELVIEKIVAGGYGLARDEKGVVLVSGALPQEHIFATQTAEKPVRKAKVHTVLVEHPARMEPLGVLPTLDLAHARYKLQLEIKQSIVQDALLRIGKQSFAVAETVPSPSQWHYRTVTQYAINQGQWAYRIPESHDLMELHSDPVAHENIDTLLGKVDLHYLRHCREVVFRTSNATGETLAGLIGEGNAKSFHSAAMALGEVGVVGVSLAAPEKFRFAKGAKLLWGEAHILEEYGDFQLTVDVSSFAQVNPEAASLLYRQAAAWAGTGKHALDLYGGSGALGLHVAKRFDKVTVQDINPFALERGRSDAKRLGLKNMSFVRGDARRMETEYDCVLIDPPRAGVGKEVLERISQTRASTLVYVSCNPATWARDVRQLSEWGWKLQKAVPYDFYPQTSHVEVLSVLER